MEQTWEEAEKILSWRDMRPDIYKFRGIEHRGKNDYGKPISIVTLETEEGVFRFYAPASLYWDLKDKPETRFLKYEGTQPSNKGYAYPVFKFAK